MGSRSILSDSLRSVVNRLLQWLSRTRILQLTSKLRQGEGKHGKFRTYYSWCRAPQQSRSKSSERWLSGEGRRFLWAQCLLRKDQTFIETASARYSGTSCAWLTSFATVVLMRDDA